MTHSTPNPVTAQLRQQDLKDRRKEEGWRRLTIWLSPQEADILQTLGDEWLGRTVKSLLAAAMGSQEEPLHPGAPSDTLPAPGTLPREGNLAAAVLAERGRTIALLFRLGMTAGEIAALLHLELSDVARVLAPVPEIFTLTGEPATQEPSQDQVDLMQEIDSLLARGLSGADIAWQFNAAGRRATNGAEYRGANLIRDWRRWKGAAI